MVDILHRVRTELADTMLVGAILPHWQDPGWSDDSCTLHSVGVTFWTALGRHLAFEAVAEMPAPVSEGASVGDNEVRSDAAWFLPEGDWPAVLVEFERYSGETDATKLERKMRNLAVAAHRWNRFPSLLVLAYWTRGLANLPDHERLRKIVTHGITTASGTAIHALAGTTVVFFQFVHQPSRSGRWKLNQVIERGLP